MDGQTVMNAYPLPPGASAFSVSSSDQQPIASPPATGQEQPVPQAKCGDVSAGGVDFETRTEAGSADGLLQMQQGQEQGAGCKCTPCDSRRKQFMWACCCGSTVIILLSFFLALYLPITQLVRETKVRLVHVDVKSLCDNPMLVTLKMQVTNPAPVRVKMDTLEVHLMRTDSKLMLVDTSEPVTLPSNVDSADMLVQMRIKSLDDSKAAQALEDLRAEKRQAYSVSYKAKLNIRVIALPISWTFKGEMDLDDMDNANEEDKEGAKEGEEGGKKVCAVNVTCWVTTFEDECCVQRGNVSLVRYGQVHDQAQALTFQSEAEAISPMLRMAVPSISAAMYLHKTTADVSADVSPAATLLLKPADAAAAASVDKFAVHAELGLQSAMIASMNDLVDSFDDSLSSKPDMRITTKMVAMEHSQNCQLQKLLSEIKIEINPSDMSSSSESTRRHIKSYIPSRHDLLNMLYALGSASAAEKGMGSGGGIESHPLGAYASGMGNAARVGGAQRIGGRRADTVDICNSKRSPVRAQEGWVPDNTITTTAKFKANVKEYTELDDRSSLKLGMFAVNTFAFPLLVKTGEYALKINVPPHGTSKDTAAQHPAISMRMPAVDSTTCGRDQVDFEGTVTFINHTRVGYHLFAPVLVGDPATVFVAVDKAGSDESFLMQMVEWGISRFVSDGINMNFEKAPVVMVVEVLNQFTLSAPAGSGAEELSANFAFELNIPLIGILIKDYIQFDIPKITMEVEDLVGVLELTVKTSSLKVTLKTKVKNTETKCNGLLSAIAFNRPARLPGNITLGTKLKPFPCEFNIKQDMWVKQSLLGSTQTVTGTFAQAPNSCGFNPSTLTGELCNVQGTSLKCNLTSDLSASVTVAASRAPVAPPFDFQLPGAQASVPLNNAGCVQMTLKDGESAKTATAEQQAACVAQSALATTAGLGLDYASVVLTNLASCKDGVGKCTHTDGADKWDDVVNRKVKLCLPPP